MSETTHQSLPELLAQSTARYGEQPAIHIGDRTITHREFGVATDRIAAGLRAGGLAKGDRVGLICANSDVFALAYFGILKAGGTVVPVNLLLNPKEMAFILGNADVSMVLYLDLFTGLIDAIRPQLPDSVEWVEMPMGPVSDDTHSAWHRLVNSEAPYTPVDFDPPNDIAVILYTSGTTGYPKGAMLTHRNLASNATAISEALRLVAGKDVLITVLPMFHAFAATVCMIYPLLNGCALVPVPKFDPALVADMIERHQVTLLAAVPGMYGVLNKLPDSAVPKFASLKYCISGGAAMPVAWMQAFEEKFGKLIYEGDGPTECSPCTCVNPIGGVRKPGSVGTVIPSVSMKILDEQGVECTTGTIGEICVRGPNIMKGYWKLPDDTAEVFFGDWLRTGDLGYVDEDGYFFIVDRKKDMVIVNGMNVYPRIIEEALHRYPAVREVAVIGEPDETHGEKVVAFVVLHDGHKEDIPALRKYCLSHLGRHEVPRVFRFVPDLPKNAAGKIMKRELRMQGELERGVDRRGL
ncbi:MAG: long-chain fatty acid--CoA ligase [Verrucomicrobia bacterium]|nr:long-chain fatty acid--CoA ligase [Verrucomicrobiota bacterium]